MATKVVDASAVCSIVFAEAEGAVVVEALEGHTLLAPSLLEFEFGNVVVSKLKTANSKLRRSALRTQIIEESIAAGWKLFYDLSIELVDVDSSAVTLLALQRNLTMYDAAYLWLAHTMDIELVTLDRKLSAEAGY